MKNYMELGRGDFVIDKNGLGEGIIVEEIPSFFGDEESVYTVQYNETRKIVRKNSFKKIV